MSLSMITSYFIQDQLLSLQNKREKLCLIINSHLLSNMVRDLQCINIGQQLSGKLIMVPKQERSIQAALIFREMIRSSTAELVGINRLEILFNRELAVDPLKLLLANAKEKTILALWPGHYDPKIGLTYAQPNHPEYRFYKPSDISNLLIIDIEAQTL